MTEAFRQEIPPASPAAGSRRPEPSLSLGLTSDNEGVSEATTLSILPQCDVRLSVVELEKQAADYARNSRASNTLRAYRSDWSAFTGWCESHGLVALPADPTTVSMYLSAEAGRLKTSTLRRRLSSIAVAHAAVGAPNPSDDMNVKATWAGIRRANGTAEMGKAPVLTADLRAMVGALPNSLRGHRDAALLLIGFAGAFRRSELVGLDLEDVADTSDGLVVTLRRSKTDQEGRGRQVGIPPGTAALTCPVRAFRTWLAVSGITSGPLFRPVSRHGHLGSTRLSDKAVALVVKRAAGAVGLDQSELAGHSLRSGMATSAARAGATEDEIMRQTGHRSVVVLQRYIRMSTLFQGNAATKLGL
jgi:site-specific recombinase XerD